MATAKESIRTPTPEFRSKSWFQYLRKNDKFKKVYQKERDMGRVDIPFNIDGLSEEEYRIALPYYMNRQKVHTIPMYMHDVPHSGLRWIEDRDRVPKSAGVSRHKCSIIHYGQRKLLLNELLFLSLYNLQKFKTLTVDDLEKDTLTSFIVPRRREVPLVVYAGAGGTGQHMLYLAKLFSGVMFYCYDLSEYDKNLQMEVKAGRYPNVILNVSLFEDRDRDAFASISDGNIGDEILGDEIRARGGGRPIYFISDIRSAGQKESFEEFEERVHVDNLMQYDWVEKIRPVSAHLKWRMPYTHSDAPIMTPSTFMLEPWVDPDSGELRQTVERPSGSKGYTYGKMTLEQFENKKIMFNNAILPYAYYEHPVSCSGYYYYDAKERKSGEAGLGLDHCWSCTYELVCWCIYLGFDPSDVGKVGKLEKYMRDNESELLLYFNQNTMINCRSLNINCHGMMPYKTSYEKYLKFTEEESEERVRFMRERAIETPIDDNLDCPYEHATKGTSHFNPGERKRGNRRTRRDRKRSRGKRFGRGRTRRNR